MRSRDFAEAFIFLEYFLGFLNIYPITSEFTLIIISIYFDYFRSLRMFRKIQK